MEVKTATKVKQWWTEERTERLLKWHHHYSQNADPNALKKISGRMQKSRSSIYHKLGRLGVLSARWSKDYR
ncbi:MAG TPA: hypothetical protein VMZ91_07030 [Candidatus Paceibacterota bacterium]|nr:hypothetical protein [Candidatus Paceibacterota bacterium]